MADMHLAQSCSDCMLRNDAVGTSASPWDACVLMMCGVQANKGRMPSSVPRNPQTEALLRLVGRDYNLDGEPSCSTTAMF